MRLQIVVTIDSASELHRPRWEGHPTSPHKRQLHIGFDGQRGRDLHLILATEAAHQLLRLIEAIIEEDQH